MNASDLGCKPLLSVDEVAVLLGASRASIYRSIERGDLPLPVFKINGRWKIARRAVERLLSGEAPLVHQEGVVKGGIAGEHSERTLDDPVIDPSRQSQLGSPPACGRPVSLVSSQPSREPTCSAARRSSSATPSV